MNIETIEAKAHTGRDGKLSLNLSTGIADTDVSVTVLVRPVCASSETDANGWPNGFFERVVGSMPDLVRADQGIASERLSLE